MTVTERNAKKEMEEVARYLELLRDRARALGVPKRDAEDLAHNAFLDACNREEPLPTCPKKLKALLFAIVKFRVLTYRNEGRRESNRTAAAHEYLSTAGIVFCKDHAEKVAAKELVELAFHRVPPEQLEVFTTKVLDNLKVREVAALLGIKENTARSRLERAIETLRLELERLDNPRRRSVRGVLVFIAISSLLGAASNAHAMVAWIRKLLRLLTRDGTAPLRALPSIAAAGAILVSPGHPRAVADELAEGRKQSVVVVSEPSTPAPPHSTASTLLAEVAPVKPEIQSNVSIPRPAVPAKPHRKLAPLDPPPDHLLTVAILALQRGNPEQALAILDGYTGRDAGAASAVDGLRVSARQAIAMRGSTK